MPEIGMVILGCEAASIEKTVSNILETCGDTGLLLCIVNNGDNALKELLSTRSWPDNVLALHSGEKLSVAAATNMAWRYLIEKSPSLLYLGTVEEGATSEMNWLEPLIEAIQKYPLTAVAMPVVRTGGWLGVKRSHATWRLASDTGIRPDKRTIGQDTFVAVFNGIGFVARRDVLEETGFFDQSIENGEEEPDKAISLLRGGWRLVAVRDSAIYAPPLLVRAHRLCEPGSALLKKWGPDLEQYNKLVIPKIITHCVAYNQEHFIEPWVRNAALYSDEILVMYSKFPWGWKEEAASGGRADSTGDILADLQREFPKLVVIEGKWRHQTAERTAALKAARRRGCGWMLIVDTDEFYDPRSIFDAYRWMLAHPSQAWSMRHVQFIKKPTWSIVASEESSVFEFAIDTSAVPSFKDKRRPKAGKTLAIPEEVCKCWHFAYVRPHEKLREKISCHGDGIQESWHLDVWPGISPGSRDFHPLNPGAWKKIEIVEPPEFIVRSVPWMLRMDEGQVQGILR